MQDAEGSVRGVEVGGGTIRPPDTGKNLLITPHFKLGVTLASPPLEWAPGGPSAFVGAEYLPMITLDRNVASEGSGTGLQPPPPGGFLIEAGIAGQGSRTIISTDVSAYGLRGGLSFPFEIAGIGIRINPAVSWVRYEYDIEGSIARAIKPDPDDPFFRGIMLEARGTRKLDALGPALSAEVESGQIGPFLTSFYVEGSGHRMLTGQRTSLNATQEFMDQLGNTTYQGQWSIEVEDWAYRFGLGVRVFLKDSRGDHQL